MLYVIAALSTIGLTCFVYGLAYNETQKKEAADYAAQRNNADNVPPVFCEEVGCFYVYDHSGCCQNVECDTCAQWGTHNAPVLIAEYSGKHRGAEEPNLRGFSGYVGEHRADNHPLYS